MSSRVTVPDAAAAPPHNPHDARSVGSRALTGTDSSWRDVIYKGNDNYYLEAVSATLEARRRYDRRRQLRRRLRPGALAANTWSYLAATYDGATLRLYLNGNQVASHRHTPARSPPRRARLQIGGDSIYGQYFKGLIDNVRVSNIALSAAAIQTDMNTPVAAGGDTTPPSAPGILTRTVVGPAEVDLSWGAATDNVETITGYQVYQYLVPAAPVMRSSCLPQGPRRPTRRTPPVAASSSYGYEVRAVDAAGNPGAFSNTLAATTPAAPDTTPAVRAAGTHRRGRLSGPPRST